MKYSNTCSLDGLLSLINSVTSSMSTQCINHPTLPGRAVKHSKPESFCRIAGGPHGPRSPPASQMVSQQTAENCLWL